MRLRTIGLISTLAIGLLAGPLPAEAQQAGKVYRIGYLSRNVARIPHRIEAFRQGLRDLGYVEGKNIVIEWRSPKKRDRYPALAAELVRLKLDVIVTGGPTPTRAVKEATVTIPIVMGFHSDPVGTGLVASLARPSGNITELSMLSPELGGKRLELLKEIVPKLSRVAVLGQSTTPGNAQTLRATELAAGALGVKLQHFDVLSLKDIEAAFRRAVKGHADAVLALGSRVLNTHRTQVADLAVNSQLPAIYYAAEFVEAGGLMFYGVDFPDLFRRAATYVDKILKGAKPGDLPVERPTKFGLVINLKTAKKLGITMPPEILLQADRVYK